MSDFSNKWIINEYRKLRQAVVSGDRVLVLKTVRQLLESGVDPLRVVNQGLVSGMDAVGNMFRDNEMFMPDVLMSARAMNEGINLVRRIRRTPARRPLGKIVIGTVSGDIHDIGKNVVKIMLENGGFLVYDQGVNVEPRQFADAVKKHKAQILALSAQLTTAMLNMKTTIAAVEAAGMKDKVKVIIGGSATFQDFADEIGAHGYAPDASAAVHRCRELLESNSCGRQRGPNLKIVK